MISDPVPEIMPPKVIVPLLALAVNEWPALAIVAPELNVRPPVLVVSQTLLPPKAKGLLKPMVLVPVLSIPVAPPIVSVLVPVNVWLNVLENTSSPTVEFTLIFGANDPFVMKSAVAVFAGLPLAVQLVVAFQFPDDLLPTHVDAAPNMVVPAPVSNMTGKHLRTMASRLRTFD